MASVIMRWVRMVSSVSFLWVTFTNIMTAVSIMGMSCSTTMFLLLSAMQVWNAMSSSMYRSPLWILLSTRSHRRWMRSMSSSEAFSAAISAMPGSSSRRTLTRSSASAFLSCTLRRFSGSERPLAVVTT